MKIRLLLRPSFWLLILVPGACSESRLPASNEKGSITIPKEELKDRIKGAWAAQTIGVTLGRPFEFQYNSTMVRDYQKIEWSDSSLIKEFRVHPGTYDDIYMDLTFMDVIEKHGIDAAAETFANAVASADYKLWFANQTARYNILQGLKPPASGHWLNNPCADDIDFQIEADFAGLMSPGMVNAAVQICDKVGHIMNYGDGYYGGVYVATLYSMALVTDGADQIPQIAREALKVIPAESKFAQCIADVLRWHEEEPHNWKATWYKVNEKWADDIGSPLGVFRPFNIDAKINAAWVLMGLLYGNGDFTRTFEIATRCGDDADCNPATAGGILAAIVGFKNIPEHWTRGLSAVEDLPFMGTEISLLDAYDLSFRHAEQMILRNGGESNEEAFVVRKQVPVTIPLEVAFEGHHPVATVVPTRRGNEFSFEFEGIGFAIPQTNIPDLSENNHVFEAQMFIDGELVETAKLPTALNHRRFTPFWRYQLPRGRHSVQIKILNPIEKRDVTLGYAVIYDNKPNQINF